MLNIIDNYYIKKYKYGVILLKKLDNVNATQIELDTDYDDTVDEDNSVYDSKLFKRCGYYSDTYTAFIGLLSKIMNEKLENVKSIQEYVEVQKQYVAVLTTAPWLKSGAYKKPSWLASVTSKDWVNYPSPKGNGFSC